MKELRGPGKAAMKEQHQERNCVNRETASIKALREEKAPKRKEEAFCSRVFWRA